MPSLRTPEGKKKYQDYLKAVPAGHVCSLCGKEAVKHFTYWKITENSFPYDLIAKTHHMITSLRHAAEHELSAEELRELKEIRSSYINSEYDYIIEATPKNKSIPDHFHLHLIVGK